MELLVVLKELKEVQVPKELKERSEVQVLKELKGVQGPKELQVLKEL